jgi:RNA polymerase sigma-70 factor (ECF subfamily)
LRWFAAGPTATTSTARAAAPRNCSRQVTVAPTDRVLAGWFEQHRTYLWGLSYRITGSAADADDVVQETFIRACQHAPAHLDNPRQWLMRVAVNAGRDVLRRRRRRQYVGPWLPTPIDTENDNALPSYEPMVEGPTLEGRYDLMESASLAFLQALEALTPTQRAVLVLRDVFDYSALEVGSAIDLSEVNVRTIHHRARRTMEKYAHRRTPRSAASKAKANAVLVKFVELLSAGDVPGIERMLAADVKAVTDGGGEFTAALRPIVGPARVARFFGRLAASRSGRTDVIVTSVNRSPAAIFEFESPRGRRAPRLLLSIDVDANGLIANVWVIANSAKLASLEPSSNGSRRM